MNRGNESMRFNSSRAGCVDGDPLDRSTHQRMAFFGLTMLGDADVFGTAKAHRLERLVGLGEGKFVEAFHEMCLERTAPRLAKEIQVDGSALMLRGELPSLITRVLGEVPSPEEQDAFLTFFDITASGTIDVIEFTDGVRNMLKRASQPSDPRRYTSLRKMREDRARHVRPAGDPQQCHAKPVLASQTCGWWSSSAKCSERGIRRTYRPLAQTDVTRNEGQSLQQYFGEL